MTKTELRASFVCHYISTTDIQILIDLENALITAAVNIRTKK